MVSVLMFFVLVKFSTTVTLNQCRIVLQCKEFAVVHCPHIHTHTHYFGFKRVQTWGLTCFTSLLLFNTLCFFWLYPILNCKSVHNSFRASVVVSARGKAKIDSAAWTVVCCLLSLTVKSDIFSRMMRRRRTGDTAAEAETETVCVCGQERQDSSVRQKKEQKGAK